MVHYLCEIKDKDMQNFRDNEHYLPPRDNKRGVSTLQMVGLDGDNFWNFHGDSRCDDRKCGDQKYRHLFREDTLAERMGGEQLYVSKHHDAFGFGLVGNSFWFQEDLLVGYRGLYCGIAVVFAIVDTLDVGCRAIYLGHWVWITYANRDGNRDP